MLACCADERKDGSFMDRTQSAFIKTESLDIAFLLNEVRLRKLVDFLEKELGAEVEYKVSYSDNSSTILTSVDDVLDLRNLKDKKLTGIVITTTSGSATQAAVQLIAVPPKSKRVEFMPIEYTISGAANNIRDVYFLYEELGRQLASLRQWYSRILLSQQYIILVCLAFIGAIAGIFGLPAMVRVVELFSVEEGWRLSVLYALVITAFYAAFILIVVYPTMTLIARFIQWLFPVGVFAIGEGKDDYETKKRAHKILGGAALTLTLSMVAFALQQILTT
jgi:hypothetical protein